MQAMHCSRNPQKPRIAGKNLVNDLQGLNDRVLTVQLERLRLGTGEHQVPTAVHLLHPCSRPRLHLTRSHRLSCQFLWLDVNVPALIQGLFGEGQVLANSRNQVSRISSSSGRGLRTPNREGRGRRRLPIRSFVFLYHPRTDTGHQALIQIHQQPNQVRCLRSFRSLVDANVSGTGQRNQEIALINHPAVEPS